jgi:protein-tyrosine phosphatase
MDRANLADLEQFSDESQRAHVGLFLQFAPDTGVDEVPDPYYGGTEAFERVLDLCEAGARGLLRRLSTG